MPRNANDRAYERTELGRLALVDLALFRWYTWTSDNAGGRTMSVLPALTYSNQACRLVPDNSGIERTDASGERVVTDWVLYVHSSPQSPIAEDLLTGGVFGYTLIITVVSLNGVSTVRTFDLITYGEHSEQGLRALYVRELL